MYAKDPSFGNVVLLDPLLGKMELSVLRDVFSALASLSCDVLSRWAAGYFGLADAVFPFTPTRQHQGDDKDNEPHQAMVSAPRRVIRRHSFASHVMGVGRNRGAVTVCRERLYFLRRVASVWPWSRIWADAFLDEHFSWVPRVPGLLHVFRFLAHFSDG